jgi:hypothetical protein
MSEMIVNEKRSLPVTIVLIVLLLMAAGSAIYFYYQYRNTVSVRDTKEIADLTQEISRSFLLPENETPTLATVTDKEKLAGQPFFQKSENGDKVLIYSQSGRAILYRPSVKKIIDVTTVNLNTPPARTETIEKKQEDTVMAKENAPMSVKIALLNGSTTSGITNPVEENLKSLYPQATVVAKEAAKKNDYKKTLVVDITGKNAEMVNALAGTLGGEVASLPSDETAPVNADILIVLAQQ